MTLKDIENYNIFSPIFREVKIIKFLKKLI